MAGGLARCCLSLQGPLLSPAWAPGPQGRLGAHRGALASSPSPLPVGQQQRGWVGRWAAAHWACSPSPREPFPAAPAPPGPLCLLPAAPLCPQPAEAAEAARAPALTLTLPHLLSARPPCLSPEGWGCRQGPVGSAPIPSPQHPSCEACSCGKPTSATSRLAHLCPALQLVFKSPGCPPLPGPLWCHVRRFARKSHLGSAGRRRAFSGFP